MCKMANIPRVVGYGRDGRGFLLTDKLLPTKEKGKFVPTPIIKSYLGIARYLGSDGRDLKMELFVTDSERREDARETLVACGLDAQSLPARRRLGQPPIVMLNPGANYGAAKCWLPEYFAELADRLIEQHQATVLISAAPKERKIVTTRSSRYMETDGH